MDNRKFHVLEGLRGLAALCVMIRHLSDVGAPFLLPWSYLAVDLFFVLSGFVLAHAYGEKLGQGLSFARFALARLIRLYPLYLAGLAIVVCEILIRAALGQDFGVRLLLARIALGVSFIPAFGPVVADSDTIFPLNYPAWSIFFELFINAVWASLLVCRSPRWTFGLILAASLVAGVIASAIGGSLDVGVSPSNFLAGFPRVAACFFMGLGTYALWRRHPSPTWASFWLLGAVVVGLFALEPGDAFRPWLDPLISFGLMPLIVYLGAGATCSSFTQRIVTPLGSASYAVYILQVPVMGMAWLVMERMGLSNTSADLQGYLPSIVTGVVIFGLALALDTLFDRPVRRWLTAASSRVRTATGTRSP